MKIKSVILVVIILLMLPLLSKSVSGNELSETVNGTETSINQVEAVEEASMSESSETTQRISATVVSNVPENLELPHAHYNSTPWISAVGMIMFTGTLLGIAVHKLYKVQN